MSSWCSNDSLVLLLVSGCLPNLNNDTDDGLSDIDDINDENTVL